MQPQQIGRVYLVGAGPSDLALFTIKGRQVLEQADAVLYDALVGISILNLIPKQAEKISVGKRAGRHSMKQEEINRLLADKAMEGKITIRLKGGDPFLFGRGGEEAEYLAARGIPYEIVPGVTSALAVPAYCGIPATHRELASSVHIITGHKKQDGQLDIDFEALRRAGGTYIFLMGFHALPNIVQGFLEAGMPPDMPAAVIQNGASAGQRMAVSVLSGIEQEAEKQQLDTPAVIVIGQVAALSARLAWYEKLPLSSSRILVTRPSSRSGKLADALRGLGAEVIEFPTVRTQLTDCAGQLRQVLSHIGDYRYLVFTSPAGVDYFFDLLRQLRLDIRCIGSISIAVIGSASAQALEKYGLIPELMPKHYNSAALGALLNEHIQDGQRVLLLRSSMGSPQLVEEIKHGKQIQVTDLAIYDTIYETKDFYGIKELLEAGGIEMAMFTSASTVRGFVQAVQGADVTNVQAVCIGRPTAEQAACYGMQAVISEKETIESMVQAVVDIKTRKCKGSIWN